MRVLPRENEEINECWISDKDRFSYEGLNSGERLQKPMIRVDGALREVEWNVALDYVAHALKDVAKTHGGDMIAASVSPHSTLEELFLLQKLTRGLGSGNVISRPRRRDFSADGKLAGVPWLGLKLVEVKDLDAALVVGSFLRKDHPLFAQRLRQLAKKSGKVSLLSVCADDPLIKLHAQNTVSPDDLPGALAATVAVAEKKGIALPVGVEGVEVCATSQAIAESLLAGEKPPSSLAMSPSKARRPECCMRWLSNWPNRRCTFGIYWRGGQLPWWLCSQGFADRAECLRDVCPAAQGLCFAGA